MRRLGAAAWRASLASLIMRNRWPSGEMSYDRPRLKVAGRERQLLNRRNHTSDSVSLQRRRDMPRQSSAC